jgi:hypothetical protein
MSLFRRKQTDGVRRQWGADRNSDPMPQVPRIAGDWTMAFGRGAVVLTVGAWVALVVTVLNGQVIEGVAGHASITETVGFLLAVSLLAASATAYLFGRLGFYYRTKNGRRTPRAMLDEFFAERRPAVTALIPSYQEEPGVILMTLLSTALQEYPDLRVVLLVDDPPNPRYAGPRKLLDSANALPAEVERLLSGPRRRFDRALEAFENSVDPYLPSTAGEVHALAAEYEYGASWIRSLSERYPRARQTLHRPRGDRSRAAHRRRRRSGEDRRGPHGAALPSPRLDLPLRGHELPAQAVRLALRRAEQGDEPEQLHRPDGRRLPRRRHPRRPLPGPGGGARGRPRRAGIGLRPDD